MGYNSTRPLTNRLNIIWTTFVWMGTGFLSAFYIFPISFGRFLVFLGLWGFSADMVLYFSALWMQFVNDTLKH